MQCLVYQTTRLGSKLKKRRNAEKRKILFCPIYAHCVCLSVSSQRRSTRVELTDGNDGKHNKPTGILCVCHKSERQSRMYDSYSNIMQKLHVVKIQIQHNILKNVPFLKWQSYTETQNTFRAAVHVKWALMTAHKPRANSQKHSQTYRQKLIYMRAFMLKLMSQHQLLNVWRGRWLASRLLRSACLFTVLKGIYLEM